MDGNRLICESNSWFDWVIHNLYVLCCNTYVMGKYYLIKAPWIIICHYAGLAVKIYIKEVKGFLYLPKFFWTAFWYCHPKLNSEVHYIVYNRKFFMKDLYIFYILNIEPYLNSFIDYLLYLLYPS